MKKFVSSVCIIFCLFSWSNTLRAQDTCQLIMPTIVNYSPNIIDTAITVCKNNEASVSGIATFSAPNGGQGAVYKWNFGDSQDTVTGSSATHVYTTDGIYIVSLTVVDTHGCYGTTSIKAYVPKDPVFAGTQASIDSVCAGEPYNLYGMAEAQQIRKVCTTPEAAMTFLPDGSGVSYTTSVPVTCFNPGQLVTNANDVSSVCINMEHSYVGDVIASIHCPNGQSALLFNGNGFNPLNTYLGEPNDDFGPGCPGNNVPGVGYTYCFSNSASLLPMVDEPGNTVPNVGCPPFNSVAAGDYQPEQNFSSLIGCPLNGTWSIVITDDQGADNGYIFYWDLDFDPQLNTSDSFTPAIINQHWLDDPTITSNNGNVITAESETSGIKCYTYQATDTFNCIYDTTVCLYVKERPIEEFTGEICPGESFMGFFTPGEHRDTLTAASGCDSIRVITVTANPFPNVSTYPEGSVGICDGDSTLLTVNVSPNSEYQWMKDGYPVEGATDRDLMVNSAGVYSIAGVTDKGCADTSANIRVSVNPAAEAKIVGFSGEDICFEDTVSVYAKQSPGYEYHWSPEKYFRNTASYFYPTANLTVQEWKQPIYLMVMNEYGCKDYDTALITGHPCCDLFVPTVFSPNGDGLNDYFMPKLRDYQKINAFEIFDRYGKQVYSGKASESKGWDGKYPDGKDAPQDVYMYRIDYTCTDGQIYHEKGDVTVVK